MTDYTKLKNAELEALLKSRSLPHTGKKADMVARLLEADQGADPKPVSVAASTVPAATNAAHDEDEIDWDDDADATAKPAEAPSAIAKEIVATNDKSTNPADITTTAEAAPADASTEPKANGEAEPVEETTKPPPDFTRGLASATMEDELAKRKARAKKFGIVEGEDETTKMLERAKKFGTVGDTPKGLNEALPERKERKRGRDADDDGERGGFKRRGRHNARGRGSNRRRGGGDRASPEKKTAGGHASWMTDADRAKAEARKAKFASAAS